MSYPFSHHLALNYGHKTESTLLGIYWLYTYDEMGQLTSGQKYLADGTAIQGLSFGYEFDDIGSRTSTTINGETASYTANSLNQYEQRHVPGVVDVTGVSSSSNVTVDNIITARTEEYYLAKVQLNNSVTIPYALEIKEDGVLTKTEEGYLRSNPEFMSYDSDGNITADGLWDYYWNGENRLKKMEHKFENLVLEFSYDSQGRRFQKRVLRDGILTLERRFLYNGFNCIAELDEYNAVQKTYVWGLDLSGSEQGAGGVGGLLAVTDKVADKTYYALNDGNGNVTGYVDSDSGSLVYSVEYSPFGKILIESGDKVCDYGFSTKPLEEETGLNYYNYRYYNPDLGRWLSRDPIGEAGGLNLYGFVGNNPIVRYDVLGHIVGGAGAGYYYGQEWASESNIAYQLDLALAFDVLLVFGAGATYENAVRKAYDVADRKTKAAINRAVNMGLLSASEGAALYNKRRNELVTQFRDKSTPLGKYIAEKIKPSSQLPTLEELYKKGKTPEGILKTAGANKGITSNVSTIGKLAKGCAFVSISFTFYEALAAEPSDRPRVLVTRAGGFVGAAGGAWVFGKWGGAGGTFVGGPPGGFVGSLAGTIIGGIGGSIIGEKTSSLIYDEYIND